MALTKIKLNTGFVTGSLPDANIPNDITISGAQTGITSVGTLSSLTTSGSASSNYIGSFTNTSATGWGLFVKGGADNDDYTLRVQDKDAADLLSVKAGGRIGIGTNDPDNLLHIKTTGSTPSIELEQDAGTSYKGLIKLAGNDLEIRGSSGQMEFYNGGNNDGDSATLALTIDSSQNATFAGDVTIGDKILYTASDYLKIAIDGTDRLWISDATDNWGLNFTGNSPFGMQITTTSDGSSSHDAFVIKRQPSGGSLTKVFEIFNNGVAKNYGGTEYLGSALSSGQTGIAASGSGGDLRMFKNGTQALTLTSRGTRLASGQTFGSHETDSVTINGSSGAYTTAMTFSEGGAGRGMYLVTAVHDGASVGTHGVYIIGVSSTSNIYLYATVVQNSLSINISGASLQLRHEASTDTIPVTVNAIPLSLTGN